MPAAAGFGPGVAYDSSQAYDEIAQSAVSFALNEDDPCVFVSRSKY